MKRKNHWLTLCALSVPMLLAGCINVDVGPQEPTTKYYDIGSPVAARDRIAPFKLMRRVEFKVTGNLPNTLLVRNPAARPSDAVPSGEDYQLEMDTNFRWRMSPMELFKNYLTAYINVATTAQVDGKSVSLIPEDAKPLLVTINLTAFELNKITQGGVVEASYVISDPTEMRGGAFRILSTGTLQGWSGARGQGGTANPGQALAAATRSFASQLSQELCNIP